MKENKIQKINFKFIFSNQKNYFIEHESYVEKRIFIQLLSYILSVLEDDLSNKRKWKFLTDLILYFNDFLEDIKSVILNVKYLLFDTNQISDIGVRKNMSENKILYYTIELIKIRQRI